jgi:hypothetical protein
MKIFNPTRDILGHDFDGVIADSIAECLVVGHNAYQNATDQPRPIPDLGELPVAVQQESRRLRNFIRHGEDYVYIFQSITAKQTIHDQSDFDRFVETNHNFRGIYREAFYNERSRFLREEP